MATKVDLGLVAWIGALAFLLGWVEMFDADVWWHVRSGRLILDSGAVPRLDPFSFASADRPWIDLHWGFQVLLAWAHGRGGVAGIILAASGACSAAVLIALTARGPGWPRWVAAWSWTPALLAISIRFDPRPEMLSLVGLAATLAVLLRVDRRPAWAWALPVVVACWVNVHALFVLGLVLIGSYWAGKLVGPAEADQPGGWALWKHLGPASALAAAASLANPYGWRGAIFPLELIGKIGDPKNPYKQKILEFMSPAQRVELEGVEAVAGRIYLQALVLLMILLPISFAIPAAWRRWRLDRPGSPARPGVWVGGALGMVALLGLDVVGLPGDRMPAWAVRLASSTPAVVAAAGLALAAGLAIWSRRAGVVLGSGLVAAAVWADFVRGEVFGPALALGDWGRLPGRAAPGLVAALLGGAAVVAARSGASVFRMLAAGAFIYLGLSADRNANVFGLVAGTVLAWNWGEWASGLAREGGAERLRPLATAGRVGLGLVLLGWTGLVVSDRFFPLTGFRLLHFGLRERPLTYAHEAARFAGGPGLPDRALAFGLTQAGVYVAENGPGRKVFMDGRLEVPSLATFETYIGLVELMGSGDPRWSAAVRSLGDPLLLIEHNGHDRAEATALADPGWRCVHFDPTASVFLARGSRRLEARYPTVDFLAQHFGLAPTRPSPADPGEDYAEARALIAIGGALGREPGAGATLLAQDRARRSLSFRPGWAGAWTLLGHAARMIPPAAPGRPAGPGATWDPAIGLGLAQSTFAYRRSLAIEPRNRLASEALAESFRARGMAVVGDTPDASPTTIPPWPEADRLASVAMHRGRPDLARGIWEAAAGPPTPGLRDARIGDAHFAAWEFDRAAESYARALAAGPDLGLAHLGLAVVRYRQGRAAEAREACRAALKSDLTPGQRALIERIASKTPF